MESKGSAAPAMGGPRPAPAAAGPAAGASKYLANLPSRGFLSSSVLSSSLGSVRVYVCDHETSPPEEQLIKTNTTNILIRTLQNTNLKDAAAVAARESRKKKRSTARLDSRGTAKRAKTDTLTDNSGQEESSLIPSENPFQSWTVERLRAHLKARGLSPKGKKDELIARLRSKDA